MWAEKWTIMQTTQGESVAKVFTSSSLRRAQTKTDQGNDNSRRPKLDSGKNERKYFDMKLPIT